MARALPRAPSDLGPGGRRLWRQVLGWLREHRLILDPHEAPMVDELARTIDRLSAARDAIGKMHPADPAWTRLAGEERQQRLVYARLVSALGLPSGVVPDAAEGRANVVGLSPRSRRGQKAARVRWGQQGGGE